MSPRALRCAWAALCAALLFAGCASKPPAAPEAGVSPADARARIRAAIPASVADRGGWASDLYDAFAALKVAPSAQNVCAVVAVIEQESGFRVDPKVPGLGQIAWREIDERAAHAGIPPLIVHGVLKIDSRNGKSYAERIDQAQTEKDLSEVFEDFTGSVPLGRSVFASWNPIRTRGPMQVNVAFAEEFAKQVRYPYPVTRSLADELFTRRGSVYFGIAHLLAYEAPYDRYLYRFADFNAGQYASRNAAFQSALALASARPLVADGALISHESAETPGKTELAARALAGRLGLGEGDIESALTQGKSRAFERTALYLKVFALAERTRGPLPRAIVPTIALKGPKIERPLTTAWYARRVDERFERCQKR